MQLKIHQTGSPHGKHIGNFRCHCTTHVLCPSLLFIENEKNLFPMNSCAIGRLLTALQASPNRSCNHSANYSKCGEQFKEFFVDYCSSDSSSSYSNYGCEWKDAMSAKCEFILDQDSLKTPNACVTWIFALTFSFVWPVSVSPQPPSARAKRYLKLCTATSCRDAKHMHTICIAISEGANPQIAVEAKIKRIPIW